MVRSIHPLGLVGCCKTKRKGYGSINLVYIKHGALRFLTSYWNVTIKNVDFVEYLPELSYKRNIICDFQHYWIYVIYILNKRSTNNSYRSCFLSLCIGQISENISNQKQQNVWKHSEVLPMLHKICTWKIVLVFIIIKLLAWNMLLNGFKVLFLQFI